MFDPGSHGMNIGCLRFWRNRSNGRAATLAAAAAAAAFFAYRKEVI
jgi:hypothetical protein